MKKNIAAVILLVTSFSLLYAFEEVSCSSDELEVKADILYSPKDYVLYFLDSGMLNYYDGKYEAAVEKLNLAEKYIDDYYTKSVSQYAASLLTNDSVVEYPGEDYEDCYVNLFKTLAYYKSGRWQEGLHELNSFKRKVNGLNNRHAEELYQARQELNSGRLQNVYVSFYDSALGEYLSILYAKTINDENQVAFSQRMIREIFNTSGRIYDFSCPSCVDEEIIANSNQARLNFVVFSGRSPYKRESVKKYSDDTLLYLPELVIPEPNVCTVEYKVFDVQTGRTYTGRLSKIEDYGNICSDVFKTRANLIYAKTVKRAGSKKGVSSAAKVAGSVFSNSDSPTLSVTGSLLYGSSTAGEKAGKATDRADLRHSKYFPGRADVGGISLDEGIYNITVKYLDSNNEPLYYDYVNNFRVKKGQMNIVSTSSTLKELADNPVSVQQHESASATYNVIDFSEPSGFSFDIGTEPEQDSSLTYGFFQYNWNESFASSIRFQFTSSTETEDEIDGFSNGTQSVKTKDFETTILPVKFNFGEALACTVSFGVSYQYLTEKTFAGMFDTNGYLLFDEDIGKFFNYSLERKGHIFAPRVGFSTRKDLNSWAILRFDFYLNPVLYINIDQGVKYYSNQTKEKFDYSGKSNTGYFSMPYLDSKVSIEFYETVRPLFQISYQNIKMDQLVWADDGISFTTAKDTQSITKIRTGFEVLAGKQKRSKVRGGVYYQKNWSISSLNNKTITKDKWIFSIGSEL